MNRLISVLMVLATVVALAASCVSCTSKVETSRSTFRIVTPGPDVVTQFMLDHTVKVTAVCRRGTSGGTGVVLGDIGDGSLVVTAKHVGGRSCFYGVENHLGEGMVIDRKEVADHDIAFLYVRKKYNLAPVTMQAPRLLDDVVATGYPSNRITDKQELAGTKGNVVAFYRRGKTELIRVSSPFLQGSSGGPIWSRDGRLLGIVSSMYGRTSPRGHRYIPYAGYYFAVPSTVVADHLSN